MTENIKKKFNQGYELNKGKITLEENKTSNSLLGITQVSSYNQSEYCHYVFSNSEEYNDELNEAKYLSDPTEDYTSVENDYDYLTNYQSQGSDQLCNLVEIINKRIKSFDELYLSADEFLIRQTDNNVNKYLIFHVGNIAYALSVEHILEISRVSYITPVPNVPMWLKGVINVGGEIISVIDLSKYLSIENIQQDTTRRMIVVKLEKRNLSTCLIVDQISSFFNLRDCEVLTSHLSLSRKIQPYLIDIVNYNNEIIAMLDIECFLLSSEIQQFQ